MRFASPRATRKVPRPSLVFLGATRQNEARQINTSSLAVPSFATVLGLPGSRKRGSLSQDTPKQMEGEPTAEKAQERRSPRKAVEMPNARDRVDARGSSAPDHQRGRRERFMISRRSVLTTLLVALIYS